MKIIDPGHQYLLDTWDGGEPILLTFVKRDLPPEKFPGNIGHYPGTQSQEVLRALIDRAEYVQNQIPCRETEIFISCMRSGLQVLERRARRMRQQPELDIPLLGIEKLPACGACGHIRCLNHDG